MLGNIGSPFSNLPFSIRPWTSVSILVFETSSFRNPPGFFLPERYLFYAPAPKSVSFLSPSLSRRGSSRGFAPLAPFLAGSPPRGIDDRHFPVPSSFFAPAQARLSKGISLSGLAAFFYRYFSFGRSLSSTPQAFLLMGLPRTHEVLSFPYEASLIDKFPRSV